MRMLTKERQRTLTLRDVLRELHGPLHDRAGGENRRTVCRGCGGIMWWPCLTRRLLDGEWVDISLDMTSDSEPFGTPIGGP